MVKCKICMKEKRRSKNFQHLHFHLLKKHGMVSRDYHNLYPDAPLVSKEFCQKQSKLMIERRKQIPNLQEKLHAWRHHETDIDYDDDFYKNATFEDLENIKKREEWCCMMLASGIRGQKYKSIYRDLMDCRRALDIVYERLMKDSL